MIQDIEKHIQNYWTWLKDKTSIKQINDWAEITTPYLDRHNDYIQIYAKPEKEGYLLTDSGETVLDLLQSGCSIDKSDKRKEIFRSILNGFGVEQGENQELRVHARKDNFALKKHSLIQAILSVNDMFFLASPNIKSLFWEDIATWLDASDIRYTPKVKFSGKTGYDHMFDFVIPKSKVQPERIIQAINNPKRDSAQTFILAWEDTRETRPKDSSAFAFLNDNSPEHSIPAAAKEALINYNVTPILWSDRDKIKNKLAA